MRASFGASLLGVTCVLSVSGCNPSTTPPANDANLPDSGSIVDTGMVVLTCPTNMIPDPTNQMGACCYRESQAAHPEAPELRLRFLRLRAPEGSALVSAATGMLLNASLANETFNWLVRGAAGAGDGPITITTGYGTRDATARTYAFSTTTRYAPVTLTGTITGEVVTTAPTDQTLIVPIFDPTGTMLQVELPLHNPAVVTSTFSEDRSCIGALSTRAMFTTAATLTAYITVTESQGTMINVDPIHAQLCTLVASSGFTETGGPYCDQPQAMWANQPDSLCPASGQCMLDDGSGSVCSHDGTGATPCNAWQLVGDFAAVGVEITP